MIQLVSLMHPNGTLLWGRLPGYWGLEEWSRLYSLLKGMLLPEGSRVVLDFSDTRHMHFRAVPLLLGLAQGLEGSGARIEITGLSAYLQRIVEVASALDGRDFVERHRLQGSPLPGPADPDLSQQRDPARFELGPHGLAAVSLN